MNENIWVLLAVLIVLLAVLFFAFNLRRRVGRLVEWMRGVRQGGPGEPPRLAIRGVLAPLADEVATLARSFARAQETAEQEARLRTLGDSLWTPERLREHVRDKLPGTPLLIVANREPYRHSRRGREIVCQMPASGLVTGLEPLLRACGGTWIAHGDGDADAATADELGRVRVPPENPQYVLRRVWLSREEERGYYSGFANEGLWSLCHIAHTRPSFRPRDWEHYRRVNEKFARAALQEIADVEDPCLLIQDYHFTLLPRLIKEERPDARVALFWHIPWPNPEAFSICPWQNELLEGMLGADLIGFHTQFHCNNFFETVDRALECRIDRERFAVQRNLHATVVKPFPISVAFPEPEKIDPARRAAQRERLLKEHAVRAEFIAVGVDRLDYTKGILERFRGVELFLEMHPAYRGRFVLFQIGAPSRTEIPAYARFMGEVEAEAERINRRFSTPDGRPIVLLARHHDRERILPFYRAADACLVTSLHDGMNLVAKEFVAARDDERGVLVLSHFTGASRELRDALIVNPYDLGQVAESLRTALEMSPDEQALRMARLRRQVRENNVYRWAGGLITELAAIRLPARAL